MAYATVTDATTLYGLDYLTVACDRDQDGVLDDTEFEAQLDLASVEIDGYLLGRYPLPLTGPALTVMRKYCVDIAVYNSAPTADVATEAMKSRHEAAIKYLELVAQGRIRLELVSATPSANAALTPSIETKRTLSITSCERQFRRDRLKGLF